MNIRLRAPLACGICIVLSCLLNAVAFADEVEKEQAPAKDPKPPNIADEPRTIDPATLVFPNLAAPATVTFDEASLREIGQWIEEQAKVTVLFDKTALEDEGIPLGEAVSDRLENAPLYLLLNRLSALRLSWYVEDDILNITTLDKASERLLTKPYNVANLLDAGYELDSLSDTIQNTTTGPWSDVDGTGGSMQLLGDVQFVRQSNDVHREIAGLLSALRKHGRQTYTLDPPQHIALRQQLQEHLDVDFQDAPLIRAIEQLAQESGADIRLDVAAAREEGIRDRQPVSLVLADRKLSTILRVLLSDLKLTWILQDGVMWITTEALAEQHQKTAVYDVRDLCRDEKESNALTDAIINQTKGPWKDEDGTGGVIVFAKNGTMVVRQTERMLLEVLDLLETYRTALRESKPRAQNVVDPNELVTRYYRMPASIALDLETTLKQLVVPDSWMSEQRPDASGTIRKVVSRSEVLSSRGRTTLHIDVSAAKRPNSSGLVVPHAVLIIRQARKTHEKIVMTIRRVEQGDPPPNNQDGTGIGGAGFGGGFFRIP